MIDVLATLALPLMLMPLWAQDNTTKAVGSSEVHRLFAADQQDRENVSPDGTATQNDWKHINERDSQRRERTHQLLAAGELKSAQDYHDAAFIFQHGSKPEDYLLAHVLATAAVAKGDAGSLWIAAATLDRYLQSIKRDQVFGTQYFQAEATKPWTQEPYDRELMPDALRSVFGVLTRSDQQKALDEEYNKSKSAESPRRP